MFTARSHLRNQQHKPSSICAAMAPKRQSGELLDEDGVFVDQDIALQEQAASWVQWRRSFPIRASGGIRWPRCRRPNKSEQVPWHVYEARTAGKVDQQWVLAPFLVPARGSSCLEGAPEEARLRRVTSGGPKGQEMERYTNIHQMFYLAEQHPLLSDVTTHKISKALDPTSFDANGRATKYHQSPWDLKLTLAASGANFHVGLSVHATKHDLVSLWWRPIRLSRVDFNLAQAIFLTLRRFVA